MDSLLICFCIICFLLTALASFILFFVNKEQVFCNRIIALVLLLFGLQNLISFLVFTGYLIHVPHVYRVLGPSTLLILPLSYIYVRSVLNGETAFRKWDWLFLIPSLLYAINLLPVYMMPYEEKRLLVENYLSNPKLQGQFSEGYLPPYIFPFIRTIWSTIFFVMLYRTIHKFKKNVGSRILEYNRDLLQWLYNFSYILLVFIVVFIIHTILLPIWELDTKISDYTLVAAVFTMTVLLFVKPRVLYGLYLPSTAFSSISTPTVTEEYKTPRVDIKTFEAITFDKKYTKTISDNQKYKAILEHYFETEKPFLNPNYSLDDLVNDIKIPKHTLSSFINQEYGLGFRKFLNGRRVSYLLQNYDNPDWKNLTFEAIANESGFKNRSTFILNFREFTQKNPMEYFKDRV
jgi:AraC-like DNA-binding protein